MVFAVEAGISHYASVTILGMEERGLDRAGIETVVLGGLAYSPMARAVAGGLAFSTVVSLLFLPTIYAILDDLNNASRRILRRARGLEQVQAIS